MREIITDLGKIKFLSEVNEEKNFKYRSYLKTRNPNKIDRMVKRLYSEISGKIDCISCANCYIEIGLQVSNSEIERISKYLKLTVSEFQKGYIEINEEGEKIFTDTPCKFLNDKKCSIYNIRPGDYASYPHLHKNHFIFRLFGVLSNCSICPIVFNVYEELKRELNYK